MSRFDIVVVGADVNAMVAALRLSRQRKSVCLVASGRFGATRFQKAAFSNGGEFACLLQDTSQFRQPLMSALGLGNAGVKRLAKQSGVFVPDRDNEKTKGVLVSNDPDVTISELENYNGVDAANFKAYHAFIQRVRPFIKSFVDEQPVDLRELGMKGVMMAARKALKLRRLGRADMLELMRLAPMCVADLMNEFFSNERLKAAIALPALYGTWCGPWSPHTALNLLIYEACAEPAIKGGALGLHESLKKACLEAGVRIVEESSAKEILLSQGQVTGLRLCDQTVISCDWLASAADPKTTFLELLQPGCLPTDFEHALVHYRMRGVTALLHLSLTEPLRFSCRPELAPDRFRIVDSLNQTEKVFDPVKYGSFAEDVVLEGYSHTDTEGRHSLTLELHFAPYELAGGWDDEKRKQLQDRALTKLSQFAPQCRDLIKESLCLSPDLIARDYGLSGGHLYHGELAPDQILVRPVLGACAYHSPVAGLSLCGSGSFPGGGLTGMPGWLGAQAIMKSK